MPFQNCSFIKPNIEFNKADSLAPMFRKTFSYHKGEGKAKLTVCALGYGYFYINGKKVTEDMFTAPVSDYRKTLWYLIYDVTELLQEGENVIAGICGNGWYNENFPTAWSYDKAKWRDMPKFILSLCVGEKELVKSDESWKYSLKSPFVYNELRCGEHYDSRLFDENWNKLGYDDSNWDNVQLDQTPPTGVFRLCECEPIRECHLYPAQKMYQVSEDTVIFDFGVNISGYVRLHTNQSAGDKILMRHVEEIHEDLSLEYNNMNHPCYYPETPFQENEFICCGREFTYSPLFTFHGFRFVEITGMKNPKLSDAVAVHVHQDIKRRSRFECSDAFLNQLFQAGIMATWSNLFYMPTDCPSREKLGWMNDAQASVEQMLTNFEMEKLFTKWEQDIFDAVRESGQLPGIVPTPEWGYHWGNGPVSDGCMFEIPYRMYLHTGDDTLLKKAYPYFVRYLDFLKTTEDENGDMLYGLGDWSAPYEDKQLDSVFPNKMLLIKFLRIKKLTEERLGISAEETEQRILEEICDAKKKYILPDGTCSIPRQSAVGMMIYFDVYDDLEPLKEQLKQMIEEDDFHHCCGMLGIRYLYHALNKCNLADYAYKIITAHGFPSYRDWIEHGATSLYERWNCGESKNHHMLSDFMSWMMKTILGIKQAEESVGFATVEVCPHFFGDLQYAKGYIDTCNGKIGVAWERRDNHISLQIDVPEGMEVMYQGRKLSGSNTIYYFEVKD